TFADIAHQRCPRCRLGQVFKEPIFRIYALRLPKMYDRCPVCNLKFEREPGYFLGAMYISYIVGVGAIILLATIIWVVMHWSIMRSTVLAMILFLPLAPAITLFARVLWIYLDQSVDPERV